MNIKQTIETIINKDVYCNQTVIVGEMLKLDNSNLLQHDDIENHFIFRNSESGDTITHDAYCELTRLDTDDVSEYLEEQLDIRQWYSVSQWLADKLFALGQPVIRLNGVGYWWGRTFCVQALEDDYCFEQIAKESV